MSGLNPLAEPAHVPYWMGWGKVDDGDLGAPLLFELIDPADIERRAMSIVTTTDALMQEAEDWVAENWVAEYGLPDADDDELDEPSLWYWRRQSGRPPSGTSAGGAAS